ncbi:hypothetical protein DM30_02770 [Brucella abortus]|nr:hypothetical protein DM30_02770 [Brucella abortus]AOG49368.1 hypothetical protein BFL33_02660 [Brucella melitensis]EXU82936.1 hypothetical protein AX23_09380 [Brucella melitensis 548]KFH21251.1 hypothetical protein IB63_08615 [Brucella abortus 544]KFH23060.1 hypothetical protein IB60_00115 [Brucella abortus LMN1]KFH25365.1 hypothetical protein IB61_07585 [Brucella abortus LMN2]
MQKIEDDNVAGLGADICAVEIAGHSASDHGLQDIMVHVALGDDARRALVVLPVRGGRADQACAELL